MDFSSVPITVPVETAVTVPLATITSVFASAASHLSSLQEVVATETDTGAYASIMVRERELEASMAYYSLLGVQATATDPSVRQALATQAAEASAVMRELFKNDSFYQGNTPSLGGNLALTIIFALFLLFQIVLGVFYRQWWFLNCYAAGLILEVLGYAGRVWSHHDMTSFDAYVMQLVCITLAPCFLMAAIYFTMAQLTVIMGQAFSILKPMQYSLIFIICDFVSIVLQAGGGAMASAELSNHHSTRGGSNFMVVGLAFQVVSMGFFQILWYIFCYRCFVNYKRYGDSAFETRYAGIRKRLMFPPFFGALSVAVILIFIRSIYRLTEMAEGFSGSLANTELYFMTLEALMVSLATLLVTVVHPGIAYGREIEIIIDKRLKSSFSWKKEHYRDARKNMDLDREQDASTVSELEPYPGDPKDADIRADRDVAFPLKGRISRELTRERDNSQ
ncbi:DEKNAAC102783 [Brettanomyces naardenensis]|uniref:Sphingoid long-chain base transporter RSB1 n=1 Tax=Brettanomyces naardenensis TaxID=13370 RepID=A0A448YKQ2_BRENA|nr:DEKNAAC102783 [Brettanomyces naardenensis]